MTRRSAWPPRRESSIALATLLFVAVVLRTVVVVVGFDSLLDDPDAYRTLAQNAVEEHVFGRGPTPTAFRPPLYPLVLAACEFVVADHALAALAVCHVLFGVATVGLTWYLARQWRLGPWSAALAGLLVAADPILIRQSVLIMTETLATLLAVVILIVQSSAARRPGPGRAAMAGAMWALGGLCRPAFLAGGAACGVILPLTARLGSPALVRRAALLASFVVAGIVVTLPWVMRNYVYLGRPVVATTHGGYTLLLGNNPWFYDYLREGETDTPWDGDAFLAWWVQRVRQRDVRNELDMNDVAYAAAHEAIRDEPYMFVRACMLRVGRLWQLAPYRTGRGDDASRRGFLKAVIGTWYFLELTAAAMGLAWIVFRWRRGDRPTGRALRTGWIWGLLLAATLTSVHAVYWSNMRMRAPLVPVVACAAVAASGWLRRRSDVAAESLKGR